MIAAEPIVSETQPIFYESILEQSGRGRVVGASVQYRSRAGSR